MFSQTKIGNHVKFRGLVVWDAKEVFSACSLLFLGFRSSPNPGKFCLQLYLVTSFLLLSPLSQLGHPASEDRYRGSEHSMISVITSEIFPNVLYALRIFLAMNLPHGDPRTACSTYNSIEYFYHIYKDSYIIQPYRPACLYTCIT